MDVGAVVGVVEGVAVGAEVAAVGADDEGVVVASDGLEEAGAAVEEELGVTPTPVRGDTVRKVALVGEMKCHHIEYQC